MKPTTFASLAAVVLLLVGSAARAADEEKTGTRWSLDLQHGRLKIVSFQAAEGGVRSYHYVTLKVTNPGALARDWYPVVKALTDTGKVSVAMGFEEALDAVKAQEGNDGLVPISATKGKIAAGQVLDTVAIFGPLDPAYDQVRVQITGLADPIAIYKIARYATAVEAPDAPYVQAAGDGAFEPVTDAIAIQDVAYVERNEKVMAALRKAVGEGDLPKPVSEYWEVSERRAYEMTYSRLGDEFRPDDDPIRAEGERWLVLGDVRLLRKIQM